MASDAVVGITPTWSEKAPVRGLCRGTMALQASDIKLIQETVARSFSVQEIEELGLYDADFDKDLRLQLAEHDLEFFARYYLPHHFSLPPSPDHRQVFGMFRDALYTYGRQNVAAALPRGFGKSTISLLAFPLWCICFGKRHFVVFLSDTHGQAKNQLNTLKNELEYNSRILEDFGVLRGRKWQEDVIETSNDIMVLALGARMKIRGIKYRQWRPDLILGDDLENLISVSSPTQRNVLYRWFTRSVVRAGGFDTKIFVTGNFLHYECLLKKLIDNPMFKSVVFKAVMSYASDQVLWDQWREKLIDLSDPAKDTTARAFFDQHRGEMLEGASVSWPEAFNYYDLMVTRVTDGDSSFVTELQNEPTDPESRFFKHWAYYSKEIRVDDRGMYDMWLIPENGRPAVPLAACGLFAFTDPSMGEHMRSDYSAIIILAKAPNRQQFVLEADIKRRPPARIINDQLTWMERYPSMMRWGIEKTQFQAFFASESAYQGLVKDVRFPMMPIDHSHNKELRIQSLQPDLENEYILIGDKGQDLLIEQLANYVPNAHSHDDGPDALEGVRTLAKGWQPLSSVGLIQGAVHKFQAARDIPERMRSSHAESNDPYDRYEKAYQEAQRKKAVADGKEYKVPEKLFVPITYW